MVFLHSKSIVFTDQREHFHERVSTDIVFKSAMPSIHQDIELVGVSHLPGVIISQQHRARNIQILLVCEFQKNMLKNPNILFLQDSWNYDLVKKCNEIL